MNEVGAKTQVGGWTGGLAVMCVLLFITPVFKNMPNNAQGAIIIQAVLGLFNWREFLFLWKVDNSICKYGLITVFVISGCRKFLTFIHPF